MLTADQVRTLTKSSGNKQQWHADGRSLYLVTKNGRGFWVLHFRDPREADKPVRNKGLGSADTIKPADARKARDAFMVALAEGRPVALTVRKAKADLFSTAADVYLSNHADEWSERTRAANKALVANKVPAEFAARQVTTITPDHVADMLRPIWNGPGNNIGSKLRQLVEGILASKDVEPNPAKWERLKSRLSNKRAKTENRKGIPAANVPAFIATLGDSIEDRAGLFTILTAVRRKEALTATWREFDLKNRVWTIPGERMKKPGGHVPPDHSVPLSGAAIALLGKPGAPDEYVFKNQRGGSLASTHGALDKEWFERDGFGEASKLCQSIEPSDKPFTLHGFRSSFGSWAEEQDNGRRFPPKVIDAALAHVKRDDAGKANKVTGAYQRSPLFDARRELMDAWAVFATGR